MDPLSRFNEIVDEICARNADVVATQMMGMPSLERGGKLFAGWVGSEKAMVFRLPDAGARERALALDGAHAFDPSGARPMNDWVVVPAAHADEWGQLAEQALAGRRAA